MIKKMLGAILSKGNKSKEIGIDEADTLLGRSWLEREEKVYKSFFPNMPDQIITPVDPAKVSIGGMPLVLSCAGVFEIPSSPECPYWSYVTSGLSNPEGDDPEAVSGYGIELLMQLPERSIWAVNLIFNLMGYVMETGKVFASGRRIPCNGPIAVDLPCNLTTLLFWPPQSLSSEFQLESGMVSLLQIHGITDEEYKFCVDHSSADFYNLLEKLPNFPAIDITRHSIV